jgi:hypothetical protein
MRQSLDNTVTAQAQKSTHFLARTPAAACPGGSQAAALRAARHAAVSTGTEATGHTCWRNNALPGGGMKGDGMPGMPIGGRMPGGMPGAPMCGGAEI